MSTPDQMAAEYDPAAAPPPPVTKASDLTSAHIGLIVEIAGVTGELTGGVIDNGGTNSIDEIHIQESDRPFVTRFSVAAGTACKVIDEDLIQLTDVVDMKDFYEYARELDRVSKTIRANKAENKALEERKRQLSEKLLGTFAQVGQQTLAFDDRRAYVHHEVIPDFEERDDGTKYGYRDLVPVLKAMGREEQVTEETVNYMTLCGLLREIRDGVIPMPPELAAMVGIGEKAEVRVGVGRKSKR